MNAPDGQIRGPGTRPGIDRALEPEDRAAEVSHAREPAHEHVRRGLARGDVHEADVGREHGQLRHRREHQVRVRVDQAWHQRAPAPVDDRGTGGGRDRRPDASDDVALDQDVGRTRQRVGRAVEDAHVLEQHRGARGWCGVGGLGRRRRTRQGDERQRGQGHDTADGQARTTSNRRGHDDGRCYPSTHARAFRVQVALMPMQTRTGGIAAMTLGLVVLASAGRAGAAGPDRSTAQRADRPGSSTPAPTTRRASAPRDGCPVGTPTRRSSRCLAGLPAWTSSATTRPPAPARCWCPRVA